MHSICEKLHSYIGAPAADCISLKCGQQIPTLSSEYDQIHIFLQCYLSKFTLHS